MRIVLLVFIAIVPFAAAQSFLSNGLTRFAGIDTSKLTGDNGPAYNATFQGPYAVARDSAASFYIGETARIRRIDHHGIISTIAGNGVPGESGDGGPATSAQINYVGGIAIDSKGDIYFSEDQVRIRRIAPDGTISTYAGNGGSGYNGENVDALSANINAAGLAIDSQDRLYLAEPNNARVRVIQNDKISTFAGTGVSGYSGENGPAAQAQLGQPMDLAFDLSGNLYVADGARVAKIDTHGVLTRVAGTREQPGEELSPDEVPATQSSLFALSVATDVHGDLFVATPRVRKITPDGIIHAFAGYETPDQQMFTEACGDALKATVQAAQMKADLNGDLFFINRLANRLEEATPAGKISTVAGDGPNRFSGDGGPASHATFASPNAIAFDKTGRLYVADTGNNRVRRIDTNGTISTVAGDGGPTYDQDPACVPDQNSFLRAPQGVAVDDAGDLFIADTGKNRVLKIAVDGTQTTVSDQLSGPEGVLVDGAGNLFITDSDHSALVKITPGGNMQKLWTGDAVGSMALDAAGNLYFSAGMTVERLSAASGAITPVAGTGEYTFSAAPGFVSGPEEIGGASAVALDADGSIYIADQVKGIIERVSHNCALAVDNGQVLVRPTGLTFDSAGNLYIADAVEGTIWTTVPVPAPASEKPTPHLGRTGIRSAAPANLVLLSGQPPSPPIEAPIAPGQLLRIRGVCIGPFEPVFETYGASGMLPTSSGETQIQFNGTPAPLVSVSAGEIIAQAPFELDGKGEESVTLSYNGVAIQSNIAVQAANPAVFTMTGIPIGPALVLNEDGTLNSATNAAARGSVVVLYATGTGQTAPPGVDGVAPPSTLPLVKLPVLFTIGSRNAGVLYAGDAPGFIGLTQLNIQVPASAAIGAQPITLEVGGFALNQSNVTIFVAP
ncbi:MAG TPA: hypothetical protein VFW44_15570 [Bryobacteraceae bacterium]|nr:hypothetical protein [Bryobacteraceae bacterium]